MFCCCLNESELSDLEMFAHEPNLRKAVQCDSGSTRELSLGGLAPFAFQLQLAQMLEGQRFRAGEAGLSGLAPLALQVQLAQTLESQGFRTRQASLRLSQTIVFRICLRRQKGTAFLFSQPPACDARQFDDIGVGEFGWQPPRSEPHRLFEVGNARDWAQNATVRHKFGIQARRRLRRRQKTGLVGPRQDGLRLAEELSGL